jgi:redox-sensitive bicupin YhaK (pirin superfamily)
MIEQSAIEQVVEARETTLVGDLKVHRILPYRTRRMVGPFTFLDEMGPLEVLSGNSGDVPPHPHIGLATVTYLFDGELMHRDGLGTERMIRPRDVNWMTAGSGIVHSERIPAEYRTGGKCFHGLQAWVALPLEFEEVSPSFDHYGKEALPVFKQGASTIHLIAGSAFGKTSPVKTLSKLFYFDAEIPAGSVLEFDSESQEAAFYLLSGSISIDGQVFEKQGLIVFKAGSKIRVEARGDSHGMFLGGAPLDGPRYIYWNFVSSSKERIEKAKQDWREQRFAKVPGETDFVPLPG